MTYTSMTVKMMFAVLLQVVCISNAFVAPNFHVNAINRNHPQGGGNGNPAMEQSTSPSDVSATEEDVEIDKNALYVKGLVGNLEELLDKYICNGSTMTRERAINVLDQITFHAKDGEYIRQSIRMAKRAGIPVDSTFWDKYNVAAERKELGKNDASQRKKDAAARKLWEEGRNSTATTGSNVANNVGRSAFSRRQTNNDKPDMFLNAMMGKDQPVAINPRVPRKMLDFANDKLCLQTEMEEVAAAELNGQEQSEARQELSAYDQATNDAAVKVSGLVAKIGSETALSGESLGIGGLDDVLAQVKRRIWIPLAAPPQLLKELGIHPVRGLLLYGKPGCGKTLLARSLGQVLSPMRPITVVSGPEVMDKFVGSSEKNLREIFDNPPDIFDTYRLGEKDGGQAISRAALHVIVLDEFDAICRTRGGNDGKGGQGDAGVARDSVVNQMLAKMDGVHPLPVPTLVIGLTNKRSLIDSALLRPGRFEVQLEVPPPKTDEQRISILKVHTKNMFKAGRVLVRDAPGGAAAVHVKKLSLSDRSELPSYDELLQSLAGKCPGFSGASLAGVARAAASHALERSVTTFSESFEATSGGSGILECLVTHDDFVSAIDDVVESMGDSDHSQDKEKDVATTSKDLGSW